LKRSTPLKRSSFSKKEPTADRSEHPQAKETKPKACAHCGNFFFPVRPMQVVCGPLCASRKVKADKKAVRQKDRAKREAMKSLRQIMAEADREFCAYIRSRDRLAGHPCISSGRPLDWTGNAVDAGHYRSRGAASHLRYHEDNCHAQSKHDNQFKAGNVVQYRINLIVRIGLERVEALEADNDTKKWTREELLWIKSHYRAKRRELERGRA
jgi:hypothetical protein